MPLRLGAVARAALEVLRNRVTLGYTLATGGVFGAFINYLTTSQQVFQEQYDAGKLFPVYFGCLAAAIGAASLTNAKLVMRFGMQRLARLAAGFECVVASLFWLVSLALDGHPPLWIFMASLMVCFFCSGILFGNYNARAMEPMGRIAGVAAAVTGSLSGVVALIFATPLGRAYDGTVLPVLGGFLLASFSALALTETAEALQRRSAR